MAQAEERGFSAVLQNRNFLFLWISQLLGQTAQNGVLFAQMVMIEELTRSSAHMAIVILTFNSPAVFFGPFSGVFIDRFRKKSILLACNVTRIFTASSYILFRHSLGGGYLLLAIYVMIFISSTIGQLSDPTESSTVPLLVTREQLLTANSLFNLTFVVSQVVGLLIITPLAVKLVGIDAAFATVALMYLSTTLLIAPIAVYEPNRSRTANSGAALRRVWEELQEGRRFILSQRPIAIAMGQLALIATLIMIMVILAPGFAARVLGMRTEDAVYVFAPAGVGMFAATLVVGRFGHRFRRQRLVNVGLIGLGLALAALGLVGRAGDAISLPLLKAYPEATVSLTSAVMALAFFLGFQLALVNIPAQTVLQERSPAGIRGRVLAVRFMMANLAAIPPMLTIGALADRIGIPRVTLLIAIIVLAVGGLSAYHTGRGEEVN